MENPNLGNECVELSVIIKDEERRMTQKFLCYEEILNQELVMKYIMEARKNFSGDPESVIFKATFVVQ